MILNMIFSTGKTFLVKFFDGVTSFFKWDSREGKWLSPVKTVIISILVFYILFIHTCGQVNCPEITKTSDTNIVTVIDTVWIKKEQTTTGGKPKRKPGGIKIIENPKTICDSIVEYTQDYEDTLLKGTLFTDVRGELIGSRFTYVPKFPKYIKEKETITITNTETIEVPRKERPYGFILGGGVNMSHNQTAGFSINVGAQLKQGFDIIYQFDPLRLNHSVGVTHTFEFKKGK